VTATNGRTATDTFDLTVTEVNDVPDAVNDALSAVNEDSGQRTIPFADLLTNDTKGPVNENSQTITVTGVSNAVGGVATLDTPNSQVLFTPTANFFGAASFDYTITDNGTTNGLADPKSDTATASFTVNAINDPPSFVKGADPTVNEDAGPQTVVGWATSISQGPGETGQTLTFNITPTGTTGTLAFSSGPAINSTTGTLTYTTSADTNGTATFDVTLSDNGSNVPPNSNTSAPQSFTITVNAVNDAPTITAGGTLNYTENAAATAIDNTIAVNDIDSTNLASATAQITGNYVNGQDVLSFTDTATITGNFNAATGTLTVTGSDTLLNYQAALRSVMYNNTSDNPSTSARTVTWIVNDGSLPSTGATSTINVTPVNDAPTLTTNAGLTVNNAGTGTIDNTKLQVTDPDNTAAQLTFTVGTAPTHGTLKKSNVAVPGGGTFTQDDINTNKIIYTHDGTATTTDSFTFTYTDGTVAPIGPVTFNITIGNPAAKVLDAKAAEPASGTTNMLFTVVLSGPASAGASVQYQTADQTPGAGHAVGGGACNGTTVDYVTTNGTLNFNAGETTKTIPVPICSDNNNSEPDETFTLTISTPVNLTLGSPTTATGTITAANAAGTFIISELRTSGPGGLGDDFVELYNNTDSPLTIAASDASGGYGVFKMGTDCNAVPVLIAQIPNGTVLPARGHYLLVGSQYSLGAYAAGDQTLTSDIESDRNVAVFSTSSVANISSANRLDAVGFGTNVNGGGTSNGVCDLFREGNTLPAASGSVLEYSFFRKLLAGNPQDTNDNSADFMFADTQGTATAMGQQLGAPGPENKTSPIRRDSVLPVLVLDGTVASSGAPNRFRDATPNMPNSTVGAFGTLSFRRRIQNNTGGDVTRLRFRIVNVTTLPPAVGDADLRAITSADVPVSNVHDTTTCLDRTAGTASNCTVTVKGTLLEQPPNQTKGGAYNSTMSVDLSGLLPGGKSAEVRTTTGMVSVFRFASLGLIPAKASNCSFRLASCKPATSASWLSSKPCRDEAVHPVR